LRLAVPADLGLRDALRAMCLVEWVVNSVLDWVPNM
jgi:hypothetical protein